jgi:hypothetical protein
MSYTAEISRSNPSCFLFLIDQSGSMQEVMDPSNMQPLERPVVVDGQQFTHTASGKTKAQTLSDVVNRLLTNMVIKCTKSEGVRDYYHIGVIGYGGDNTANRVQPAFAGSLAGRDLVPIHEIAETPARVEERNKKVDDGAGGLVEQKTKFPIWLDPVAAGGTPMCAALNKAQTVISDWTAQHPNGFPPIVFNITDGESTDGDPSGPADAIKALSSSDGNVLLFNIHISSKQGAKVEFPDSDASLADENARRLFNASSILPPQMQQTAKQEGIAVSEMTRGFAFNADLVALVRFLDIGTRPSNLR